MGQKLKETTREPITKGKCRHYWLIETANGPTSRGVCKFCGAEKDFYNSWPGYTFLKRNTDVFELPDSPEIGSDRELADLELEESGANL
ncbi:MAG: hypothetical protein ACE5LA_07690 [Dehalococcoidales bacterium]